MKRLKKILKWTGIVLAGLVAIGLVANAWFVWSTDRRLESQLAAIRAAHEPLTLAELAPKPIPPEQNAATYLRQAAADVEAIEGVVWVGDWCRGWGEGRRISSDGAKLVKVAFDAHPHVMRLLDQAAACPDYDLQLDFKSPYYKFIIPFIVAMPRQRACTRVLELRAYLLAMEGKRDEAVQTSVLLMRLAHHFERDGFLISDTTGTSFRAMAIGAANAALQTGPVSREVREALDAELARLEPMDGYGFRQAILSERVGQIAQMPTHPSRNSWLVARGYWNRQESRFLDAMRELLMLPDGPIDYRQAMRTIDHAWAGAGWLPMDFVVSKYFGDEWGPVDANVFKATVFALVASRAKVRSLRVLNALQTHVPPDSDKIPKLSELGLPKETTIDPFNGEPLHVKRLPNGWLVYSVGPNMQDDGGKIDDPTNGDVGVGPPSAARPAGK